tara:strand:- start:1091 stop:1255 length:165 start_codon:yes stop_codon:yes gene_type:complete
MSLKKILDAKKRQRETMKAIDPDYAPGTHQQGVIDTVYDLVDQTTRLRDEDEDY